MVGIGGFGGKNVKTVYVPDKVAAKVPTATEPGNIEYWYCGQCGLYFADEALTKEITKESTVLAATGQPDDKPTGTESPKTGDSSHVALWIAFLLLSCGSVIGTTVYSRRRKPVEK